MNFSLFRPFDQVVYTGNKFRSELRGKVGMITARVQRTDHSYVVEFESDGYVLHEELLKHWTPANRDDRSKMEQEVYHRRRLKKYEED